MLESIRIGFALIAAVCVAAVFPGCQDATPSANLADENQQFGRVAVTNFPLYCFVEKLCQGSDAITEVIYVGPGENDDPHAWMPTGAQIRDLQKVDLVICNGPGAVFSAWMEKVTIDESKLCKTTDAMKLTEFVMVEDFQLVHSHGPEGEHSHTWVVPQSWLSPKIARKQAKHCFDQLTALFGQSSAMENAFADLQKDFDQLESVHEQLMQKSGDMTVASATPDLQYLTRSLGWNDRYLHWNEPREIEQAKNEIAQMRDRYREKSADDAQAEDEPAKHFLWAGKKFESLSDLVAENWEHQIVVDLIDAPQGAAAESEGYFSRMKNNLERLSGIVE